MGRLIYADKLNEEFDDLITTFENTKNGKDYISKEELLECLKLLRGCVDEQPTAFDIENVVAELKNQAELYRQRGFDYERIDSKIHQLMADKYYGKQCSYLNAIDIVRNGGVE